LRLVSLPRVLPLALPCALALACAAPSAGGGGGEGEGEGEPAALTAADYCETIVGFFCPYYVRCGRMAVSTVDECRPVFLSSCEANYEPSYVSLEDAGLLTLSRAGVDACSAHLDDVACEEQLLDLDGPCSGMWVGTQPAGAACGFDIESFVCAPGSTCTLGLDLCGTCEAIVADGARCDEEGVTCARTSSCVDGVCEPRLAVGAPCEAGDTCVLGARCRDGACAGPAYVGVDDACDLDHRCAYASTCAGGACVATSDLDEACGANADGALCHSGWCDADQGGGQCVELLAQGGACTESRQCQTNACVDGACLALPSACFDGDG
jgi:hypothetical protein